MGRQKQSRPHKSGAGVLKHNLNSDDQIAIETLESLKNDEKQPVVPSSSSSIKPFFVEIDHHQRFQESEKHHLDIAEVVVVKDSSNSNSNSIHRRITEEEFYGGVDRKFSLRFRLSNVENNFASRFRLGQFPITSTDNIFLEFYVSDDATTATTEENVVFSGVFDGSNEGVTGLVHLVSQKILTIRPILMKRVSVSDEDLVLVSVTVRVEILENAFDGCESLLDTVRKPWKKSMMSVMAWLRPEVLTQEAIYGEVDNVQMEIGGSGSRSESRKKRNAGFNAAEFYNAIKPTKREPMLDDELPDLVPELRPYQRRAAYWMVQREKEDSGKLEDQNQLLRPLCVPVQFLDTDSRMFYNPFSGNISLHPELPSSHVSGGILADEMGLGKTVELLACIFAHRKSTSEGNMTFHNEMQITKGQRSNLKRLKRERVECICGAVNESPKYKGIWVQCDICDAWQHADCVGYSPVGTSDPTLKSQHPSKKKTSNRIVEVDGNFICQLCLELIQVSDSPVFTRATLIVCPASILQQWHAEIIRHIEPGSLKTRVYEGVRNASLSAVSTMEISELVDADIVLTTYDVLKEDLSHDSDRHEGDRRFMRFKKRYPVIPTLLTRIFWWRICLDEAQMVESNAAAATEMALRLHAKYHWCITGTPIQRKLDDLYGLLRFLKASPFEVHKWWIEVIRDPYERKDAAAMRFAHKFFKKIMWRSSKVDVANELQLPPQTECVSWLSFSPIEAHFYKRQHETCVSYARQVIKSFKDNNVHKSEIQDSESSERSDDPILTHNEASKLLYSLLKLRQACCHPQVGSSGLRSLQQCPMTMEEILGVLVGKTKTEGEEALRRLIVALNGLAGIAVIEQDPSGAVSMYREALTLAEEHSDDFRLDPLLNLHIHHNLAEIHPVTSSYSHECHSMGGKFPENPEKSASKVHGVDELDQHPLKRQRISKDTSSDLTTDYGNSVQEGELSHAELSATGVNGVKGMEHDAQPEVSSRSFSEGCLRTTCENIKQKFLSVFISKLSLAQQEFRNSHMQVKVYKAFSDQEKQHEYWWLEALEQNKDTSNELIRRICEAVSGTINSSKSSIVGSRFRSTTGLKYLIQTGLDSLETSRQALLGRILEIDQTMEKPRDEDIERVRYCRICQNNNDGPICVMCELDELFQVYEARLFRLTKGGDGEMIASAEEAVDLQKKRSELNRFYWSLSRPKSDLSSAAADNEKNKKQRDVRAKVVVSRSPSELEIVLGVIKNYAKARLGREAMAAATKHLVLFEAMRKEYAQARCLATAQAQILRAHDEIKMATSRLRLRENKNDTSIDALSSEELVSANVELSNEKFQSLSLLLRIKGQLGYLKGLVTRQKTQIDRPNSPTQLDTDNSSAVSSLTREQDEFTSKVDDEACPVCLEKLNRQKMVFQCGHITCCKCFVAISEKRLIPQGKSREKWVMCPTCRQHTDFRNIAYADDRQNKACYSGLTSSVQGREMLEASINVRGSYGTKIEAVTRRILWIKTTDQKAKVLVFSSWNDVLDVLEHAFSANNISHIRMKGGRKSHIAISQFKGQNGRTNVTGVPEQEPEGKSVQVLLILIQHGANGLNLLEAQHVVLIEPLLNPAAEAQAINRVHRIGQDKMTLVHRFIVNNTVEESIYKLNKGRASSSIISGSTKNQDQPVLTLKDVESLLKDVESLFSPAVVPSMPLEDKNIPTGNLMHLPPAVAAAVAAERRWKEES